MRTDYHILSLSKIDGSLAVTLEQFELHNRMPVFMTNKETRYRFENFDRALSDQFIEKLRSNRIAGGYDEQILEIADRHKAEYSHLQEKDFDTIFFEIAKNILEG